MPRSGNTYSLPSDADDIVNGSVNDADPVTTVLDDIETELTRSWARDGTGTPSADIPMGGFKATGNGLGSAATDLPTVLQIQQGRFIQGTDATSGGTPNTIVVTCSPVVALNVDGMRVRWTPLVANSGTATFNPGTGGLSLKRPDGNQLGAGDVASGMPAEAAFSSALGYWILASYPAASQATLTTKGDTYAKTSSGLARQAAPADGGVTFGFSGATTGLKSATLFANAIRGWTYQNSAGDATNDIDIAAGAGMDSTGVYPFNGSALTKQLDANWVVGDNQGGLDTGSIGNSAYYIWAIARSDTGVVDYLFSLSSTAPTMPTSYDYKRLIGWFKRVAGAIVAFKTYETAGGGLLQMWSSPTLDIDLGNTLTTTRRTDAVKAPLNLSTTALLNVTVSDASATFDVYIYCPDMTDLAPGDTLTAPLATIRATSAGSASANIEVRTSATGTIAARASLATVDTYEVVTLGFRMDRR